MERTPGTGAGAEALPSDSRDLVVAKLDQLSRDAEFLLRLQKSSVKFVAANLPDANELTVGFMAIIAQHERKAISDRTKRPGGC